MLKRRRYAFALISSVLAAGLSAGCASGYSAGRGGFSRTQSEHWSLFRGTPQRLGLALNQHLKQPVRVAWVYQPQGATNGFLDWGAVAANGLIYTPNGLNRVVALDAKTGRETWSTPLESNVFSVSLSEDGSTLFAATAITAHPSPTLYALDARTGVVQWNNQTDGQPAIGGIESAPVIDGKSVYAAHLRYNGEGGVCAYDSDRGHLRWCWKRDSQSAVGPLALSEGRLYASFDDQKLFCLDARTGKVLWLFAPQQASSLLASPVVFDKHVFLAWGNALYALDVRTGGILWTKPLETTVEFSSPALANGVLYVGTKQGTVLAVSARDGKLIWKQPLGGGAINSSPVLDLSAKTLWIGTADNAVIGVSAATGEVLSRIPLSDQPGLGIWKNSVVLYDNWLYIGSLDKRFYALKSSS